MSLSFRSVRAALVWITVCAATLLASCQSMNAPVDIKAQESEVRETESAFAKTMADRDFEAFKRFIADEAVFFSGATPLKGKAAVADAWARFFKGPDAPFSWEPKTVVVLETGGLALSTGPVYNPAGEQIGTFNSIWRREGPGTWRIVFDKGS